MDDVRWVTTTIPDAPTTRAAWRQQRVRRRRHRRWLASGAPGVARPIGHWPHLTGEVGRIMGVRWIVR